MTGQTLWRIDADRNMHRFYTVDVQPDLFGGWCFIRSWGRIGTDGQTRSTACASLDEAQKMLAKHRRVKEKEGYTTEAPPPPAAGLGDAAGAKAKRARKADEASTAGTLFAAIQAGDAGKP